MRHRCVDRDQKIGGLNNGRRIGKVINFVHKIGNAILKTQRRNLGSLLALLQAIEPRTLQIEPRLIASSPMLRRRSTRAAFAKFSREAPAHTSPTFMPETSANFAAHFA